MPNLLTPDALALYPQTKTACYDALSKPSSFGGLKLSDILKSGVDLTPLLNAVGESDPEHLRPKTAIRIEQGTDDKTVIPAFTQQLVDEYKQNGVSVVYKTYDGVSHGGVVNAAAKDSTNYIKSRLK